MQPNTKSVSVQLPASLWRYLKLYCLKNDKTVKQFIMEAVAGKLKEIEVTDNEKNTY